MTSEEQTDVAVSLERLILRRITVENWAQAPYRSELYRVLRARLTADTAADGPDSARNRQFLQALVAVSTNIEAAATAAKDYDDFLELVRAARESQSAAPPAEPKLPPAPNLRPPPGAVGPPGAPAPAFRSAPPPAATPLTSPPAPMSAPSRPSPAPASASAEAPARGAADTRPVRTIPLWPLGLVAAVAGAAIAFWPAGSCSLTSATCIGERQVTAGPALTDEDARLIRLGLVNLQATPTHVFARLRVNNTTRRTLHAISPNPTRLSFRIRPGSQPPTAGRPDQFNVNRIELTQDIPPGATVELPLMAVRPQNLTAPVLDVTFVVEGRFWAFTVGVEPLSTPLPP